MEEQNNNSKKVTIRLVVSWIFSLLFCLIGFIIIFKSFITGILFLIATLILLPPANAYAKRKWNFFISGPLKFIIVFLLILFAPIIGNVSKTSDQEIKSQQSIPNVSQTYTEVPYKLIEERDISYAGCKRVVVSITVPDDANKDDLNYTIDKIIDGYKSEWQHIAVFAYKYSEEQLIGEIGYTMGKKEYSTCK